MQADPRRLRDPRLMIAFPGVQAPVRGIGGSRNSSTLTIALGAHMLKSQCVIESAVLRCSHLGRPLRRPQASRLNIHTRGCRMTPRPTYCRGEIYNGNLHCYSNYRTQASMSSTLLVGSGRMIIVRRGIPAATTRTSPAQTSVRHLRDP